MTIDQFSLLIYVVHVLHAEDLEVLEIEDDTIYMAELSSEQLATLQHIATSKKIFKINGGRVDYDHGGDPIYSEITLTVTDW